MRWRGVDAAVAAVLAVLAGLPLAVSYSEESAARAPAEVFSSGLNTFDLEGWVVRFAYHPGNNSYTTCLEEADGYLVDPAGGQALELEDDSFKKVDWGLTFFGTEYDSLFVGSNGYVTFGGGDTDHSPSSLLEHYSLPRVSGLYADLLPDPEGSITFKIFYPELGGQLAAAITYDNVMVHSQPDKRQKLQIVLFGDGQIAVTYKQVQAGNVKAVAGLSPGDGWLGPSIKLSDSPACQVAAPEVGIMAEAQAAGPAGCPDPQTATAILTAGGQPAQMFSPGVLHKQLEGRAITFTPHYGLGYGACLSDISDFPVNPEGGQSILSLVDDGVQVISGFVFPFFGLNRTWAYVGSNGYITFGAGDNEHTPSPTSHFSLLRIAALWTDLTSRAWSNISWKLLQGGAAGVAITFDEVSLYYAASQRQRFQVVLKSTGEVVLAYVKVDTGDQAVLVGISGGYDEEQPELTDITSGVVCGGCPVADPKPKAVPVQSTPASSAPAPLSGAIQASPSPAAPQLAEPAPALVVPGEMFTTSEAQAQLEGTAVIYSYEASIGSYSACKVEASDYLFDPEQIGASALDLGPDEVIDVSGFEFPFFGTVRSLVFISPKGHVTFGPTSTGVGTFSAATIAQHLSLARVSALFADLVADEYSAVTWSRADGHPDVALVVTWHNVASSTGSESRQRVQLVLRSDGAIVVAYPLVDLGGAVAVVGLSPGAEFSASLSSVSACDDCSWGKAAGFCFAPAQEEGSGGPPWPAQVFQSFGPGDLQGSAVTFTPQLEGEGYSACTTWSPGFHVNPMGGENVFSVSGVADDMAAQVQLGFDFPFFGTYYSEVFVSSNGCLTFGAADDEHSPSLQSHFSLPRVSVFWTDLVAYTEAVTSRVVDGGDALAITWDGAMLYSDWNRAQRVQAVLYRSGVVVVSIVEVDVPGSGSPVVVGISGGQQPSTLTPFTASLAANDYCSTCLMASAQWGAQTVTSPGAASTSSDWLPSWFDLVIWGGIAIGGAAILALLSCLLIRMLQKRRSTAASAAQQQPPQAAADEEAAAPALVILDISSDQRNEQQPEGEQKAPSAPPAPEGMDLEGSDTPSCVICMDQEAQMAFVPCGHMCVCVECAKLASRSIKCCPMCRRPSTSLLRVWRASG